MLDAALQHLPQSGTHIPVLLMCCSTYLGPMSAAVYLPLLQPDEDGTSELSSENKKKLGSETARIGRIYDRWAATARHIASTAAVYSLHCIYKLSDAEM